MIHTSRLYAVSEVDSAEDLASKLTTMSWTLCTAFELEGLLFANDAFSEDGAQEYAVVRGGRQVDSVTFSWCTTERALAIIAELLSGAGEDLGSVELRLERRDHRCPLCA